MLTKVVQNSYGNTVHYFCSYNFKCSLEERAWWAVGFRENEPGSL